MEASGQLQHRSRSPWRDLPQRPALDQRPDRHAPVGAASPPRARVRLLREEATNTFSYSTLAAGLETIELSRPVPNSYDRPGRATFGRRPRPPARKGLAAWQQVVVAAYIEKHIAQSIRTRALARFVYLSSDCFCRAFKRSFGMPPHRYLVQKRIERAKALLESSGWSITDIGVALGFSQRSSFSAAFRHVAGVSPTEYRRTQR